MINYETHVNKRQLQKELLSNIKAEKVYCLGGPNIGSYSKLYSPEVKKIISYEEDKNVWIDQQLADKDDRVELLFGSILNAPLDPYGFFDMDLCCTMIKGREAVEKYKDMDFMFTFSMRNCTNTEGRFFYSLGEVIQNRIGEIEVNKTGQIIVTDKHRYFRINYFDSCSMTIFKKLKD